MGGSRECYDDYKVKFTECSESFPRVFCCPTWDGDGNVTFLFYSVANLAFHLQVNGINSIKKYFT